MRGARSDWLKRVRACLSQVEYNIGACLHQLEIREEAQEWYERAQATLEANGPRWLGPILIGEVSCPSTACDLLLCLSNATMWEIHTASHCREA